MVADEDVLCADCKVGYHAPFEMVRACSCDRAGTCLSDALRCMRLSVAGNASRCQAAKQVRGGRHLPGSKDRISSAADPWRT